jgi:hypothetical protein
MPVDVAIHCGDMTEESKTREMEMTINLLKIIDAPLKLVIPGNHDSALDVPVFKRKIADVKSPHDPELVKQEYGDFGDARKLFEQAVPNGIILLNEGIHNFNLQNEAQLKVYASPYTQSRAAGGFQFTPEQGHEHRIGDGVDVVITHDPPRGILDRNAKEKAAVLWISWAF